MHGWRAVGEEERADMHARHRGGKADRGEWDAVVDAVGGWVRQHKEGWEAGRGVGVVVHHIPGLDAARSFDGDLTRHAGMRLSWSAHLSSAKARLMMCGSSSDPKVHACCALGVLPRRPRRPCLAVVVVVVVTPRGELGPATKRCNRGHSKACMCVCTHRQKAVVG